MKHQNDEKVSSNRVGEQESEPHFKEAEAGISEFSETKVSSQPSDWPEQLHNVAEDVTFDHSNENECQSLEVSKSLTSRNNPSNTAGERHEVPHDYQHDEQPSVPTDDLQFQSFKALFTPDRGNHEGSIFNIFQMRTRKFLHQGQQIY